ncbi:hypothetical protein [Gluconobacter oxydans]|uniref:Uncharacterized protein n=1 Tax=Gluconobacter oxydans NBRC 3293 TaxID=1315969 RepID=A0A829X4S8_GLUOY|nr:hypothetical protein [Gluconobacter oxydans]GEM17962.1 hypothetical protein NBRC3293_2459 [Gluconobacter oxydans NBRC 3293]
MARASLTDLMASLASSPIPVRRSRVHNSKKRVRDVGTGLSERRSAEGEDTLTPGHEISWRALWGDNAPPYPLGDRRVWNS